MVHGTAHVVEGGGGVGCGGCEGDDGMVGDEEVMNGEEEAAEVVSLF